MLQYYILLTTTETDYVRKTLAPYDGFNTTFF